jgi:transcriptional regulator of met regulon
MKKVFSDRIRLLSLVNVLFVSNIATDIIEIKIIKILTADRKKSIRASSHQTNKKLYKKHY